LEVAFRHIGILYNQQKTFLKRYEEFNNKELHDLYSSPSMIRIIKSRRMRWTGHVARMVGKPEGRRPLGRPRRRWADNIKMDLREIGRDGVDIDQWRALENTVLNFGFHKMLWSS
jgi:hypothetical protein